MRKFFAVMTALFVVLASASGAFAVEYGATGYETEGYDEEHAWEISSAATLVKVRDDVNYGYDKVRIGSCFKFTNDIDLTGTAYQDWEPINITAAQDFTFDGNNHTVKVRIVCGREFAGLFGHVKKGTIKNLSVSGSIRQHAGAYYMTSPWAGGIVACLEGGNVDNCNFDGKVASSSEKWDPMVGGITGEAGENAIKITNCKVGANSDTTLSSSGGVFSCVGGIVGNFKDKDTSNRITGNYACATPEGPKKYKGLIYGTRGGISGTISGNTEVNPEGDDDDSDDDTDEGGDSGSNNDSDNTNGNSGDSTSGNNDTGNNNSNPGQDSGGDSGTSGNNGTNGNTGNDTSQNSTNTGETVNNPQAQSNINVGTGGGGGCDIGLGFIALALLGTALIPKR